MRLKKKSPHALIVGLQTEPPSLDISVKNTQS